MSTIPADNWTAVCAADDIPPDTGVGSPWSVTAMWPSSASDASTTSRSTTSIPQSGASACCRAACWANPGRAPGRGLAAVPRTISTAHRRVRGVPGAVGAGPPGAAGAGAGHGGLRLSPRGISIQQTPHSETFFMAYLAPAEFVTKMVDAGESKLLMSTCDTLIRAYMAGAILALGAAFCRLGQRQHRQSADRRALLFPVGFACSAPARLRPADRRLHAGAAGRARQASRRELGRRSAQLEPGVLRRFSPGALTVAVHGHHLHLRLHRGAQCHRPEDRLDRRGAAPWAMPPMAPPACWTLFIRGVMCNWMVSTGVVAAMMSTNVSGKVIAIWMPILVFFYMGFFIPSSTCSCSRPA